MRFCAKIGKSPIPFLCTFVQEFRHMKKMHILGLVLIAVIIAVLLTFMNDITTYDSIASAKSKEGKFVHIIAKLDTTKPVVYDPVKDPNYLSFTAIDSLGATTQVVYKNAKPTDFEKSQRIVMKGAMKGEQFECKEILLKCPSKYKDDPNAQKGELDYMTEQKKTTSKP